MLVTSSTISPRFRGEGPRGLLHNTVYNWGRVGQYDTDIPKLIAFTSILITASARFISLVFISFQVGAGRQVSIFFSMVNLCHTLKVHFTNALCSSHERKRVRC